MRVLVRGRPLLLAFAVASAWIGACSAFDAASDPMDAEAGVPDGTTDSDGATNRDGSTAVDAGYGDTQPTTPCPLRSCPPAIKDKCADDDCEKLNGAVQGTGSFTVEAGTCKAESVDNFKYLTRATQTPLGRRRIIELAFQLVSLNVTGPAAIAEIRSVDDDVHSIVLGVDGPDMRLCEMTDSGPLCEVSIPKPPNGTRIHLYGVASADDPPNARFILRTDCDGTNDVALTLRRPFPDEAMRGFVGCRTEGPVTCRHAFDDFVFIGRPE